MYKIQYLKLANIQLYEAMEYITKELCAPEAAREMMQEVTQLVNSLSEMPYRFSRYYTWDNIPQEVHVVPIKNYKLYYKIDESKKTVKILRFIHQSRMQ